MPRELDFLIKNATIFDGISVEPQHLTVGLGGDRIAYVGGELSDSAANQVIDAKGLYLCPGFIDTHASTGFGYTFPNAGDHKLYQGVTTEIIGNCGASPAPIGERFVPEMRKLAEQIGFDFNWRTLAQWFAQIEDYGIPLNMGTLIGHNVLRAGACEDPEAIKPSELDQMRVALRQALDDGALGMSTGLVYAPGSFADTGEIIELAKAVAKVGGCYVSHIRNERENLQDAVDEAIEIGRQAGVRVLVSHLKAAEKPNWGKLPKVIETIESARESGVRITFEVYPYTAVSTKLSTFIPKDALNEGAHQLPTKLKTPEWRKRCGDWLSFRETDYDAMILITESLPGARAMSIKEVAVRRSQAPADAVVDALISDPDAWIVYNCISEDDLDDAILWPNSIVCSDSWSYPVNAPNQIGDPHPRTFGAFTRFLECYALKTQRLAFGEAVCKISSFAADWLGMGRRGRIAEGCFSDLLLLNPENVAEKATFENPRQFSSGTEYLWVNGTMMIRRGELLTHLPGKVIRRELDAV